MNRDAPSPSLSSPPGPEAPRDVRRATSFASFARAPHRGRVAAGHQLAARLPRSGPSARRFGRSGISAAVSQQRRAEAGQPSCRISCRATRPSSARRTRKITHTPDQRNMQQKLSHLAYVCFGRRAAVRAWRPPVRSSSASGRRAARSVLERDGVIRPEAARQLLAAKPSRSRPSLFVGLTPSSTEPV